MLKFFAALSSTFLHYFNGPTQLFSDLYQAEFRITAKLVIWKKSSLANFNNFVINNECG